MSDQVIRLICPNLTCRTILSVPAAARGKDVRCRACGTKLRIPQAKVVPAPSSDVTAAGAGEEKKTA